MIVFITEYVSRRRLRVFGALILDLSRCVSFDPGLADAPVTRSLARLSLSRTRCSGLSGSCFDISYCAVLRRRVVLISLFCMGLATLLCACYRQRVRLYMRTYN